MGTSYNAWDYPEPPDAWRLTPNTFIVLDEVTGLQKEVSEEEAEDMIFSDPERYRIL